MIWSGEKKKFFLFGVAMATMFVFFPFGKAFASEITPDKVVSLVNDARLGNKVSIVTKNDALTLAAQMKVDDMFAKGYFAHTSPEGKTPWTWFDKAEYDYSFAGENLAIHFTDAESEQRAWMESPTHRKNILNPEYHEIGVAVRKGVMEGKETIITVQEFGSRQGVVYPTAVVSSAEVSSMQIVPVKSVSEVPIDSQSDTETSFLNQVYEQVLLLFWGVMIAQILVVGYMTIRVPKRSVRIKIQGDREYKIPVKIFSEKSFETAKNGYHF